MLFRSKPTTSEFQDCRAAAIYAGSTSKPKGRCSDKVSKDLKAAACTSTAPTSDCVDVVNFFRGACRDKSDWSHMTDPAWGAPDAGPDVGVDTGADTTLPVDVGVDVSDAG